MTRMDRHYQKKKYFGKIYLAYLCLILIAFVVLYLFVRGQMLQYERGVADNYVLSLVSEADENSDLGLYLEHHNFSDKRFGSAADRISDFYSKVSNSVLEAKASTLSKGQTNPVYDISADGKPFMTISLKETGSRTILGIMTLSEWDIDYAIVRNPYSDSQLELSSENTLDYTFVIPEDFSLLIDGVPYAGAASGEQELQYFEYVSPYVDAPKALVYQLADLYFEPEFSVLNNGDEALALEKQDDGSYSVGAEYAASPQAKELTESICDPLYIGELWSKFMTDDVGGAYHGLNKVISDCMLLKDNNLYTLAKKWAGNVDITFVSGHTLDSFENEKVENYVQYNDNLISCDVYFEKNMTIKGVGSQTDVFSNRMYFGNVDGHWYLLDMLTLEY